MQFSIFLGPNLVHYQYYKNAPLASKPSARVSASLSQDTQKTTQEPNVVTLPLTLRLYSGQLGTVTQSGRSHEARCPSACGRMCASNPWSDDPAPLLLHAGRAQGGGGGVGPAGDRLPSNVWRTSQLHHNFFSFLTPGTLSGLFVYSKH